MLRSVMQTAAFLALRAHSIVPGVSWRSHTGRHTSAARLTFDWHSPARYATAKAFTYEPVESSYAGEAGTWMRSELGSSPRQPACRWQCFMSTAKHAVIDEIDYDPARANSISLIGTAGGFRAQIGSFKCSCPGTL